jgi:2-oxoglutarate ferredoxin oxidoreductase subunit beta
MPTLQELQTPYMPNWCPGCGNFTIWAAFKNACVQEGWDNTNTALVADIGCNGHIVNFTKITSVEGLHGRPLPVATGLKLANHDLNVFAFTGDGGCLGEGGNHFIHTCRRNHNINIIIHNNALYALTTGQTSPTTQHGYSSKSTPDGNPDPSFYPISMAIAAGATFVARVYSGNVTQVQDLIVQANKHQGVSVVEVLQPCVTFHKECTHTFYQEHIYQLPDDWDVTNKEQAFAKSLEWGEKRIPVGLFYKVDQPTYESQFPFATDKGIVKKPIDRSRIRELFESYT